MALWLLGLTPVPGQAPASPGICTSTPRAPLRSRVLHPPFSRLLQLSPSLFHPRRLSGLPPLELPQPKPTLLQRQPSEACRVRALPLGPLGAQLPAPLGRNSNQDTRGRGCSLGVGCSGGGRLQRYLSKALGEVHTPKQDPAVRIPQESLVTSDQDLNLIHLSRSTTPERLQGAHILLKKPGWASEPRHSVPPLRMPR